MEETMNEQEFRAMKQDAAILAVQRARGQRDKAEHALRGAEEARDNAIARAAEAGASLVEISVQAGVSKQRVSQIVNKAREAREGA